MRDNLRNIHTFVSTISGRTPCLNADTYKMTSLYIFNPENDLALANGSRNYYPPPAARKIARDLAVVPLWYSREGSYVVAPEMPDARFMNEISEYFDIRARILQPTEVMKKAVPTCCIPWGWSPYIQKRFADMGVDARILPSLKTIGEYRELSNRKTTITILTMLSQAGIGIPEPMPFYTQSLEEAMHFVTTTPRSVLKAPWSGSGHGLVWGRGMYERSVEQLCRGIINRQGGIICERGLNKHVDFAMEFYADKSDIRFAGYSLFSTDEKGAYQGNLLAPDRHMEDLLCRYVKREDILAIRQLLPEVLKSLVGEVYRGYLGVDMMIYDDEGTFRISPCVELNLRMSMGALSRILYDRYMSQGTLGRLDIIYFDKEGDAAKYLAAAVSEYPRVITDGKLVSGALSLAPVNNGTNYLAIVRCGMKESEFEKFPV